MNKDSDAPQALTQQKHLHQSCGFDLLSDQEPAFLVNRRSYYLIREDVKINGGTKWNFPSMSGPQPARQRDGGKCENLYCRFLIFKH